MRTLSHLFDTSESPCEGIDAFIASDLDAITLLMSRPNLGMVAGMLKGIIH